MIDICKVLKTKKEISDYKIISKCKESYELFFVKDKLETVRSTDTKTEKVYVYVDHDNFRGSAAFSISLNDTLEEIEDKIDNAVSTARIINNQKYVLPKDESFDQVLSSNFKDYAPKELGTMIYDVVVKASNQSKAQFNACEIFINKNIIHIINSQNIDKKEVSYDAMIELIPTYDIDSKGNSVELYKAIHISEFDEISLYKDICESLNDVTDRANAIKLDKKLDCPILLRSEEIEQLVSEIAYNLNFATIYSKANLYNVSDNVQKDAKGDLLNVSMCGSLKGSAYSHLFDEDGLNLSKVKVIKDGVCVNTFGGNQFAQYLNKKPTGNLSLIEVKAGSLKLSEIKNTKHLECVSFSGLQVDLANDYIGGEVRLAKYVDSKNSTPFTSLSISGKVSDILKSIKLSKSVVTSSRYKGPKYALLEGFKIL